MSKRLELSGKRFGKWTVLNECRSGAPKRSLQWLCRCDCGTERFIFWDTLRYAKSCGCWRRETTKKRMTIHGMSNTKVHAAWGLMKKRCYNKKAQNYPYYGGRGITVCKEWKNSFIQFYKDMGHPPSEKHSLDRIDNEGHYEKQNCKWSTMKEQCLNRRGWGAQNRNSSDKKTV